MSISDSLHPLLILVLRVNASKFLESHAARPDQPPGPWLYDHFDNVAADVGATLVTAETGAAPDPSGLSPPTSLPRPGPEPTVDRPLILQFCASEPADFAAAAALAARRFHRHIACIDLNLGCPQATAKRAGFGAFLMEHPDAVETMVSQAVASAVADPATGTRVPISVKIRVFDDVARTVAFAKMLERAGCSLLAVHGRTRAQRHHEGRVRTEIIRAVVDAVGIPVIANGGITDLVGARAMLSETGAAAVMAAGGLLANTRLFDGVAASPFDNVWRYLDAARADPPGHHRFIKDHLLANLRAGLRTDDPVYNMLARNPKVVHIEQYYEITRVLARRQGAPDPEPQREVLGLKAIKDMNKQNAQRPQQQQLSQSLAGGCEGGPACKRPRLGTVP